MTLYGSRPRDVLGAGCALLGLTILFAPVVRGLVGAWITDANYSHGFVIVPVAAWFAWERRARWAAAEGRASPAGLAMVLGSIAVLAAGRLGSEAFLSRVAMLGALGGSIWFLWGAARLRVMTVPLLFLLLMIPLPAIVFNQVALPLQLLASQAGEYVLSAAGVPVVREGNVLVLANVTLEVAEACSGIRSLVSLVTLGIVFGYVVEPRRWLRWAIVAATVPVAVLANAARVAGVGLAAHRFGAAAAEGTLHAFSGWVAFVTAAVLIAGLHHGITRWVAPAGHALPLRGAA